LALFVSYLHVLFGFFSFINLNDDFNALRPHPSIGSSRLTAELQSRQINRASHGAGLLRRIIRGTENPPVEGDLVLADTGTPRPSLSLKF